MRGLRRTGTIGLGTLLGLIAFELVLQLVALVVWLGAERAPAGAADATTPVVLCVGDSFTYGLGAREPAEAYPAVLERRLRERGLQVSVVNAGWPGNTSRDVLRDLPRQLAAWRPTLVYVLVGTNDLYFRPPRTRPDDGDGGGGFPLRFRTLRLLQLVVAWLEGSANDTAPPAFVGTWHDRQVEVTFEPSGRMQLSSAVYRWFFDGDRLVMENDAGWRLPVSLEVEGDTLVLHRTPWWPRMELTRGPAHASTATALASVAIAAHDHASARRILEQELAAHPDAVPARELLVRVLAALGESAEPHLRWLRVRFAEDPRPSTGEALVEALRAAGHPQEAWALAARLLAATPSSRSAVASAVEIAGHHPELRAAVADALRSAAERQSEDRAMRAELLRAEARVVHTADPERALRAVLRTVDTTGDAESAAWWCRAHGVVPAVALLDAAIAGADAAHRAAFARFRELLVEDPDRALGTLDAHLEAAARLCREHGAVPVVLTYPGRSFDKPGLAQSLRGTAARLGVELVDLRVVFDDLDAGRRERAFEVDGHCSSEGYAIIAARVAEHAAAVLRTRK